MLVRIVCREKAMLLEKEKVLRGHVFMGRGGFDVKEIADIVVILIKWFSYSTLPLSVLCYSWTPNKDLLDFIFNPVGDSYIVVFKTVWLLVAQMLNMVSGLGNHRTPEKLYIGLSVIIEWEVSKSVFLLILSLY